MSNLSSYYSDNKLIVWLMIIVLPLVAIIVGVLFYRRLFWDSFLWRYFWAPIIADSEGGTVNGIHEGYNIVNTLVYGLVLLISFFGISEMIDHFGVDVDDKFVYSLLPWIILGGSLRSLEDAGILIEPFNRLMISPLIYFILGFFVIFLMIWGCYLYALDDDLFLRLFILLPLPIFYVLVSSYMEIFIDWVLIVLFIILLISFFLGVEFFEFNERYVFFTYGSIFLSISLSYNILIIYMVDVDLYWVLMIPLLGLILTILFLGFFKFFNKKYSCVILTPLNIIIVLAHFIDASSTYIGISKFWYFEKHVLANFLIIFGGLWMIFLFKVFLILFVIYFIDVYLKDNIKDSNLLYFLKFLVIVLGFSPAVRNILRLAMGV